jgi:hypothetical protein
MNRRTLILAGSRPGHPLRTKLAAVRKRRDDHDLRLFALSFTAFFICFSTLIF